MPVMIVSKPVSISNLVQEGLGVAFSTEVYAGMARTGMVWLPH